MNFKEYNNFIKKINSLLDFLLDKIEECYYNECKNAIIKFKEEMGLEHE